MVELTKPQIDAIEAQRPTPVQVVNPVTHEVFVLIRKDVYDLTCKIVGGKDGVWDDEDNDLIAKNNPVRKPA